MILSTPKLKVIHVTTHIGLIDAIAKIEPGLVERTIARAQETLTRSGIEHPRIGVCGINPHAGEHGLFGYGEEKSKIEPAVRVCQARGWNVEGPLPADTLFFRASRGDFDIVVAMYHDQGHGPVKVLGIEAGVGRQMQRGTSILATIGATAPFVGLFGTVWGIMNSFIGISKSQTTNLAVVAPGIAEALLATAFGLAAAIPAVVIYNMFSRQIAGYRALLGDTSAEVLRIVGRDLDRAAPPRARTHLSAAE